MPSEDRGRRRKRTRPLPWGCGSAFTRRDRNGSPRVVAEVRIDGRCRTFYRDERRARFDDERQAVQFLRRLHAALTQEESLDAL